MKQSPLDYWVGIDLGSTTTKAVVLNGDRDVLGRGITNSRSNYDMACQVALGEALINVRFSLMEEALVLTGLSQAVVDDLLASFEVKFRRRQYLAQLAALADQIERNFHVDGILSQLEEVGSGVRLLPAFAKVTLGRHGGRDDVGARAKAQEATVDDAGSPRGKGGRGSEMYVPVGDRHRGHQV